MPPFESHELSLSRARTRLREPLVTEASPEEPMLYCQPCLPPPPITGLRRRVIPSRSFSRHEGTSDFPQERVVSFEAGTTLDTNAHITFEDSVTTAASVSTGSSLSTRQAEPLLQEDSSDSWMKSLLRASNYAGMFCILDCTILPILTVILPLWGMVSDHKSLVNLDWLEEWGHIIALGFVLPVGILASFLNYRFGHASKILAAVSALGLSFIFLSNGSCTLVHWMEEKNHHDHSHGDSDHHHHHDHGESESLLTAALHQLAHGMTHKVVNLLGCFLMLLSNYISRKWSHEDFEEATTDDSTASFSDQSTEEWVGESSPFKPPPSIRMLQARCVSWCCLPRPRRKQANIKLS